MHGMAMQAQQPVVVPLDRNVVLQSDRRPMLKSNGQVDTVSLPFIDDFSYYARSNYPDPALWADRNVYINNDYPYQPRSNGVATFDALDAGGKVYRNKETRFGADTLTSAPIDLGAAGLKDVRLSFFYQPQGYGDNPEPEDMLILQFKSSSHEWIGVWNVAGSKLQPFKQVVVTVPQAYYYKGFRFRFVNLVSLEQDQFNPGKKGDADHWHIDYVRMKSDWVENDTAMNDVAVIAPGKSLITGYQSIPWKQIEFAYATRLEPKMEITYRNNHNEGHFVTRQFEIKDMYRGTKTTLTSGGGDNIMPEEIRTFEQDVFDPFISTSVDSALFKLTSYLGTDFNDRKVNDTVSYFQVFKNYFARDDGVPESGYGYMGDKSQNFSIACRYETFMPDSLQAVQLYFNPTANDVTKQYVFKIAVWRDNNGRPGDRVYLSDKEYSPETFGKFVTCVLEKAVYVTKYYWIGWQQVTSGFLNVGFDRNFNDKGNLWYDSFGSWQQDMNDGTLMIRPVFGKRSDYPTSVIPPRTADKIGMKIYPNPASQQIYIAFDAFAEINPSEYDAEIYAQTGRLRYRGTLDGLPIDVSRFEPGVYIVRLVHKKSGHTQSQKILIFR